MTVYLYFLMMSAAHASCGSDIYTPAPVQLLITERTTSITHGRTDATAQLRVAYVKWSDRPRRQLHSLKKPILELSSADTIQIVLTGAGQPRALDKLPAILTERLVHVLSGRWDFGLSDCAGFACFLKGSSVGPRDRAVEKLRDGEPVTEAELHPGDLVAIQSPSGLRAHVAIYLGHDSGGLYLSQFGLQSLLGVASLDQMIAFYGADRLFRYQVMP